MVGNTNSKGTNFYSTEEKFTGDYWIDGKKIYRRVIQKSNYDTTETIQNRFSGVFSLLSGVDTLIDIKGTFRPTYTSAPSYVDVNYLILSNAMTQSATISYCFLPALASNSVSVGVSVEVSYKNQFGWGTGEATFIVTYTKLV